MERLDFYSTLELTRSSTLQDVRRAYKKLAMQKHPDMDKGTDAEFVAIGLAYHVLSNAKTRAQYDTNELEFATTRASIVDNFDMEQALQIFEDFFGTANPFATITGGVNELFDAAEQDRKPKPAAPIELTLSCTLLDLYNGAKKTVSVPKKRVNSEGEVVVYTKTYIIMAEPYWIDGTVLVFEKDLEDVTGDVIFTIKVEPHDTFTISGYDLSMMTVIPLYNALTGTVLNILMPDGRKLNLSVEEVVRPDFSKVVKGEGLLDKATGNRGDLIINFKIQFPDQLGKLQKELLRTALCMPNELTDDTNLQAQLLRTAMSLPHNLSDTERKKVEAVNHLTAKRDETPPPE